MTFPYDELTQALADAGAAWAHGAVRKGLATRFTAAQTLAVAAAIASALAPGMDPDESAAVVRTAMFLELERITGVRHD